MSWISFLGRSWQLLATLSSCSPSKPVLGLSEPEINAHFDDRFGKDRRLFTKLHFPLFKDILGVGQCSSWWIKPSMWFGHLYNWSPPYLFLPFYWAVALFWRFIILAVWSASLVPSDMFEHFFKEKTLFFITLYRKTGYGLGVQSGIRIWISFPSTYSRPWISHTMLKLKLALRKLFMSWILEMGYMWT